MTGTCDVISVCRARESVGRVSGASKGEGKD